MKYIHRAIAIAAAIATTIGTTIAKEPLVLLPSGSWNVHYADDSCQLAREFGSDDQKVIALFDQYAPGNGFEVSMSGKPTAKLAKATGKARAGFGPDLPLEEKERLLAGTNGAKEPMILIGHLNVFNNQADEAGKPAAAAQLAKIRELHVLRGGKGLILQLGPLGPALKAMSACTADLVKMWGLDPVQQSQLISGPVPMKSPGDWLRAGDYPRQLVYMGEQALVRFRLLVNAEGKPTVCKIQTATQSPELKALTCELIMKRAQFEPARDKDGAAVASYYVNSALWLTG